MRRSRPVRPLVLTVTLATSMALTLTGCTADTRVPAVEETMSFAASRATPLMIGVLVPDVAKALSDAGDQTTVMVPILAPDLTTATDTVIAESGTTDLYPTAADAAVALADTGLHAWQDWLDAHRDEVGYVETLIPVAVSPKGETPSAQVDENALKVFAGPIEQANLKLFVQAAEALPQWQQTMVIVHDIDFLPMVTALPASLMDSARFESVVPANDGRFVVTVRHADPEAAIRYQVQQAIESYGEGKIWGEVTRKEFESRMAEVTDLPASAVPEVTSQATVQVTTTGEGTYSLDQSLAENLAAQAARYHAEPVPGSFPDPPDLDQVRSDAIDAALQELAKRTVPEQKRPGTGLLIAGSKGQRVVVDVGSRRDWHITFFTWGSTKPVVSVFIRKGKKLTLRVPVGTYRLVYASGDHWYGTKYSYGPSGNYEEFKAKNSDKPAKIKVKANYWYTYSIDLDNGVHDGQESIPGGTADNPFEQ